LHDPGIFLLEKPDQILQPRHMDGIGVNAMGGPMKFARPKVDPKGAGGGGPGPAFPPWRPDFPIQ
jgi:hypothetical protein